MGFHKSNYLSKINYIFLYIITIFGPAIYNKNGLNENDVWPFLTIFILLSSYLIYVSYKRLEYSDLKKKMKKRILILLSLPYILIILLGITGLIIGFFIYFLRVDTNIISKIINFKYLLILIFLVWGVHFLAFLKIVFTKVDKSKKIEKKTKNILKQSTKLYLIFMIIVIAIMQFNGHLINVRYQNIGNYNFKLKDLKTNNKLAEIIRNGHKYYQDSYYDKKSEYLKYKYLENKYYLINNNTLYYTEFKNKNKFFSSLKGDIYRIINTEMYRDSILDNISKCSEKKYCTLKTKKLIKKYKIGNDLVEIFLFYLFLGLIIFKRNLLKILFNHKIFYYIFLPFRVLFLLIKKYIFILFPKFIKFIKNNFSKLEDIEKDLKKKK